jgi:N-carbamoyl-L-amino-acid hydrolase
MLARTRSDGTTLARGIEYVGGKPDEITRAAHSPHSIAAYLEVHIEQGPVLEERGIDIGVVTEIAGIHRERIVIHGRADHSGTTPMDIRRDALAGAAQVVREAHRLAVERNQEYPLVATIGKLDVHPNAVNAVPETVVMTLEVRSGKHEALRVFVDDVLRDVQSQLPEFRVTLDHQEVSHVAPIPCDAFLQDAVEKAAESNGYSSTRMPSGAGHDGVFLSHAGPIGMIFTPCLEGRSHTPVEWADAEACAKGANTLLSAILAIDSELT